jgi:hypothetical protein
MKTNRLRKETKRNGQSKMNQELKNKNLFSLTQTLPGFQIPCKTNRKAPYP